MRSTTPGRRRGLIRTLSVTAVGAVAGAAMLGAAPAMAAEGDIAIDVLSINDFHGRIEANGTVAGAAVLAGAVDSYRAANPNTLFVSAGDNIGASTFTSKVQDDQPTLDVLNEMGLDVSTLGNHEFDKGRSDVDGRVSDESDFPYVNANLFDTATGERAYDPYFLAEQEGVSVAFIGAMTEDLGTLVSPGGISTLSIEPIVENVNEVATALQDGDDANGEADVIVLLLHEGADAGAADAGTPAADPKFGAIVNGVAANVDAIVSGHSHQEYNATVDGGRAFPTIVSQTGSYAENIGHMALTVDPTTKELTSLTSEVVPLTVEVDDPESDDAADTIFVGAFDADPAVTSIVEAAQAVAVDEGSVKVGTITDDISRAYREDGQTNRGSESTLGNLVADAQLWATSELGTEIAFTNAGGLRDDLLFAGDATVPGDADGVVTYAEASDAQPFANTLVTLQLTGAQIKALLEEQWVGSAAHPQLKLATSAALTYVFDPAAPQGEHISEVFFENVPVDPAQTFTVVTNNFLSTGGDGFSTFTEGTGTADSGRIDLDAFVAYIQDLGTVSPDPVQRSIGLTENIPDSGEYAVGDTMTVDLSSLLFSTGAPTDTTVTASVDGTEVGTAPIDPTRAVTDDSTGRASFSVPIAESLAGGTHTASFALEETGVTVSVDFAVADAAVVPTPVPEPTGTTVPTTPAAPTKPVAGGPTGGGAHQLAATGFDTTPALLAGAVALLLGAAMSVAHLRRRTVSK